MSMLASRSAHERAARRRFYAIAKHTHPDHGGSTEAFMQAVAKFEHESQVGKMHERATVMLTSAIALAVCIRPDPLGLVLGALLIAGRMDHVSTSSMRQETENSASGNQATLQAERSTRSSWPSRLLHRLLRPIQKLHEKLLRRRADEPKCGFAH